MIVFPDYAKIFFSIKMADNVSAMNADTMDETKQRKTIHKQRYSNLASNAGDDHADGDN
jgi:hypothetical protein